jgi:drug/metabolite transporter (DMT)-like permease
MTASSSAAPGAGRIAGLESRLALVAAFCIIWSSAFAAAKIALADCPPLLLLGVRFLVAGTIMLAAAWMIGGRPRLTFRDVWALALLGVLNNAVYLGFAWTGMTTVSSGFAAVLVSSNPILVALVAAPLLGERMTRTKLAGLLIGFAGVVVVLRSRLGGGIEGVEGTWLLVAGLVSLVLGTVMFKKLRPGGGLIVGNGVQCLAGGLAVLPAALLLESPAGVHVTPSLVGGFAYLVLVVSIGGYAIWFHLLGRTTATAASALHFLMPPLGLLFGWAILGEPVPPLDLVGVVPIAIGIRMVTRPASS